MKRMIRMHVRQVVAVAVMGLAAAPAAYADLAVQHDSTAITDAAGNGNGIPEPGDTLTLTENVMSVDPFDTPSGVSGTLSTAASAAGIAAATSAYADLVFGTAVGNATPFSVSLASSMECGVRLPFSVSLQTSSGSIDVPFDLPTGSAGPFSSYNSTEVPRAIPDGDLSGMSSGLTIGGDGGRAKNVRVRIGKISHTYDGDLTLYLLSPDGRSVKLVGGKGDNGQDFVDTVFDDSAASAIRSTTAAPFTGTFKPAQPLSEMDGAPLAGRWALKVVDGSPGNIGSVDAWGMDIAPAVCAPQAAPPPPPPPPPHDCGNGNGNGNGNGKTKPPKKDLVCPVKKA